MSELFRVVSHWIEGFAMPATFNTIKGIGGVVHHLSLVHITDFEQTIPVFRAAW